LFHGLRHLGQLLRELKFVHCFNILRYISSKRYKLMKTRL
jgi:hypothetical protein